jgi:hypothetical protein
MLDLSITKQAVPIQRGTVFIERISIPPHCPPELKEAAGGGLPFARLITPG